MDDGLRKFKDDLRKAGREHPQLLIKKLKLVGLSELEFSIMRDRYVDGLLVKQIAYKYNLCERWIKKVHRKATTKTLDSIKASDLLELGVHFTDTLRALYLRK